MKEVLKYIAVGVVPVALFVWLVWSFPTAFGMTVCCVLALALAVVVTGGVGAAILEAIDAWRRTR